MCKLDLVVDFGSANTVIVDKKKGLVLSEPSVIAVKKTGSKLKTVAVGNKARKMAHSSNKPDGVYFIYPIQGGVVTNLEAGSLLLKGFLERVTQYHVWRPQLEIMCVVSCGLHTTERHEFENVFYKLGLHSLTLVEAPVAVASSMVAGGKIAVVMGAGVTDIAIVGEKGIVAGASIDISASKMQDAIISHVYGAYNVNITKARAEDLLEKYGTLCDRQNQGCMVRGKSVIDGTTKNIEVTTQDVRMAITPLISTLADAIAGIAGLCPDNLIESVNHAGVHFYGGVCGIVDLDQYMSTRLHLPVEINKEITTVANKCALFLNDKGKLYHMLGIKEESK